MSDNAVLAALARLESALARLEGGQERLRVDLMACMDRLQEVLRGIRDDIEKRKRL